MWNRCPSAICFALGVAACAAPPPVVVDAPPSKSTAPGKQPSESPQAKEKREREEREKREKEGAKQQEASRGADPIADGPAKPMGPDEIRLLIKALPLRADSVSFTAIDRFFLLYAPFTEHKALLRSARDTLRAAQDHMSVDQGVIGLNSDAEQLSGLLKASGTGGHYCNFITSLQRGISRVRDVILDFREALPEDQRNNEAIVAMVGGSENDAYGIATRNNTRLGQLLKSGKCASF